MDLLGKEQHRNTLGQIWTWWKRDLIVLGEPVGPRWMYFVFVVLAVIEVWWESIAGPGRIIELDIYRMR